MIQFGNGHISAQELWSVAKNSVTSSIDVIKNDSSPNEFIADIDFENNKDISNSWIIDPIDGTINFLHGIPHFAISIALKSDDEIICGLIFDPIKDEMFYAEKNNGAFFNNQRIRVSKKNNLDECLFAVGKLKNEPSFTYRRSGCAALDIAYVASGRLDGYAQSNLNLWDIAAGIVLVKEAGGMINDIDLNNIKNIKVLASSAEINTKFKEKLGNF